MSHLFITPSLAKINGSVTLLIDDSTTGTDTTATTDDDGKMMHRTKTPMPRGARTAVTSSGDDDLNEEGIIDRDEDEFRNEDDDVSSSTAEHSSDSLEEYMQEEQRINAENLKDRDGAAVVESGETMTKWRRIVFEMKEKGRGLSCKNVDNVISEERGESLDKVSNKEKNNNSTSAACVVM